MGTGPHCSWRRRARAFPEPSTAAQAGVSPTSARAIGSGPAHMVCGRAGRCCQLSLTVSTRRWKHYQEKLIPERLIPPPPGAAATSGVREEQRQKDALVCPGSHMLLVPGCCSSLSPAIHPRLLGQGKGHPAPRATAPKCPHPLLGPLRRKPLTQSPESDAASRHHLKSHSGPAPCHHSESISMLSHSSARAGASSQRGATARGDGGHLGRSRAMGAGPPAAQLFCCPSPQGHRPGLAIPHSCAKSCPERQRATGVTAECCGNPTGLTPGLPATGAVGAWPRAALTSPRNTMFCSMSSNFNLVLLEALEPWMPNAII